MVKSLPTAPSSAADCHPLDEPLTEAGWSSVSSAQGLAYQLSHGDSASRLTFNHQASAWIRAQLQSPLVAPPKSVAWCLIDDLPGLIKLVESSSGERLFVADVPGKLLHADAQRDYDFADGAVASPLGLWAEALTAIARGDELPPGAPIDWSAALAAVEGAGWTASRDGDGIKITIAQPGQFYEIAVSADKPCGLRVSTELSTLHAASSAEHAAALLLLREVNERVQLVRMRYVDGSPARLVAEVRLSLSAVPMVWLMAALEAVHAAIVLIARPLAALRGPRLAESVLAAHTK